MDTESAIYDFALNNKCSCEGKSCKECQERHDRKLTALFDILKVGFAKEIEQTIDEATAKQKVKEYLENKKEE